MMFDPVTLLICIIIFLYGAVIGSFLNVCIFRIPKGENIAVVRSHCLSCGYNLKWYDNIPLLSYICLRGSCRKCHAHISLQYPIIEAMNAIVYLAIFIINGLTIESGIYCLAFSAFIVLSVIDFRTQEIPVGINIFLLVLGLIHTLLDYRNVLTYVIGLFSVSLVLAIIYYASKGLAIGGGDVKLMAVTGLLFGWKLNLLGFILGCIFASIIHPLRMKIGKEGNVLAMGPYLCAGVAIAALFGNDLIVLYLKLCGF